ncbi:unnamed protein product [Ectocarpus fasciculatus]
MAEGFSAADYVTNLPLSEVQGKRLWLLRVPRHIDISRLEGVKVKLPRKGREGKVLGRANKRNDSEDSGEEEDGSRDDEDLALRAGDVAETHGFRALFSAKEDGALAAAPPFVGQVNVSVDMPDVDTSVADGDPRVETFVEPYQGRPQLKGMRVRYKPAGAGSEYSPSRPLAGHEGKDKDREDHEDGATPATPDQGRKAKKTPAANSGGAASAQAAEVSAETPKSSKKKKRKSTAGGASAEEEGHGVSSPKKSKKKKGVER